MSSLRSTDSVKEATPDNLHRQIAVYSLSAAAAGVSLLALVAPAKAEVVVTRTHLPITQSAPVLLDLNKDGVADFKFSHNYGRTSYFSDNLNVCAALCGLPQNNEVVGGKGNVFIYASALVRGTKIGPSDHFTSFVGGVTIEASFGDFLSSHTNRTVIGKWGGDPSNRYLGVRFVIGGETHYGWVRLTVTSDKILSISGTITGYAYETVPNKPIPAGTAAKPSAEAQVQRGPSLGMLALGADVMPLWRSRREDNLVVATERN